MHQVIRDPELCKALQGGEHIVELRDEAGNLLGHVFPESHRRMFYDLLNSLVTDEELEQAEKDGGGSSLADFWKQVGRA